MKAVIQFASGSRISCLGMPGELWKQGPTFVRPALSLLPEKTPFGYEDVFRASKTRHRGCGKLRQPCISEVTKSFCPPVKVGLDLSGKDPIAIPEVARG
jgi:hypothetical protein